MSLAQLALTAEDREKLITSGLLLIMPRQLPARTKPSRRRMTAKEKWELRPPLCSVAGCMVECFAYDPNNGYGAKGFSRFCPVHKAAHNKKTRLYSGMKP